MTAPERSLAQRMAALERANVVRVEKARLKRDLAAGRGSIHDLLLDPPGVLENAKVFEMLLAVPKYGRVKVNKALTQCRISPSKTMGGLSDRQRIDLTSLLRRPVVASNTAEYQRQNRLSAAHAVHGLSAGRPMCGHAYSQFTTAESDQITCLSCIGVVRANVRQRIRDAREATAAA